MTKYFVHYSDPDDDDKMHVFETEANSEKEAEENCLEAYPDVKIVDIVE